MKNTDKARAEKRREKVDYILSNGTHTHTELAYLTDIDLTYIVVKIRTNIINN